MTGKFLSLAILVVDVGSVVRQILSMRWQNSSGRMHCLSAVKKAICRILWFFFLQCCNPCTKVLANFPDHPRQGTRPPWGEVRRYSTCMTSSAPLLRTRSVESSSVAEVTRAEDPDETRIEMEARKSLLWRICRFFFLFDYFPIILASSSCLQALT